jgi:hypothetical protein
VDEEKFPERTKNWCTHGLPDPLGICQESVTGEHKIAGQCAAEEQYEIGGCE